MKKLLLMLLVMFTCFGFTGCKDKNKENEKEPVYENSDLNYLLLSKSEEKPRYNSSEEYQNFVSKVGLFSTDFSEKAYTRYSHKYDQMAISPISIYMALAMATGVAETDAQVELANMLGISYEDIVEYTKYLFNTLSREYRDEEDEKVVYKVELSNSIWLDSKLTHKQEGLELLKNSFYADSYKAPFSTDNKKANKAIQDFIYRNTKGLINNEYNFNVYTLFLLINTLYLKDVWTTSGKDLTYTEEIYNFKNKNNTSNDINLLKGYYQSGKVQQGDGFEYFYTSTCHNLKLYFIKPTTKSLDEIYTSSNLNIVLNDNSYDRYNHELKEEYFTRCYFPEFNASFNEDIVDIVKEDYGVTKIFRDKFANFNRVTDELCVTTSIVHQTKLIVNKTGIEGAAVTIMAAGNTGAPVEEYTKVYNNFIVDKSFGFMITSGNIVLFSGVVNNL